MGTGKLLPQEDHGRIAFWQDPGSSSLYAPLLTCATRSAAVTLSWTCPLAESQEPARWCSLSARIFCGIHVSVLMSSGPNVTSPKMACDSFTMSSYVSLQ